MSWKRTACVHLSPQLLQSFEHGTLPEDQIPAVESHLERCSACCDILAEFPDEDFLVRLRLAHENAPTLHQAQPSATPPPKDTVVPLVSIAEPTDKQTPQLPGYEDMKELGRGGMGVVYAATHSVMARRVAVKVIHPEFSCNPAAAERFRREVRAAARLSHPNIVTAHDADQDEGRPFLVMEFIDGESLGARLDRCLEPLSVAEACDAVRQAALGVQHAHDNGLIHRDLKPHNLIRTADGTVKVCDFGLAALIDERQPSSSTTAANALMGTPDYMAPEQAEDARKIDGRADVYSLGCTLFHLLTGQVPFPEESVLLKLVAHRTQTRPSARRLRPDVLSELDSVLRRAMARRPEDRYQTPDELAEALRPFTDSTQPQLGQRRRRWKRFALAAVVILGMVGSASIVRLLSATDRETIRATVPQAPLRAFQPVKPSNEVRCFGGGVGIVGRVFFLPDGERVLSMGHRVSLWNIRTGELLSDIAQELQRDSWAAAISPDGRYALFDNCLFDLKTGKIIRTLAQVGELTHWWDVAFSPDGRRAAFGGRAFGGSQWTVWVSDVQSGKLVRRFGKQGENARSVAYSPDGKYIAAGHFFSSDNAPSIIRVYEVETGKIVYAFTLPTAAGCLAFSSDSKRLLSANDRTIRLWDLKTGVELKRFEGHTIPVEWVVFTPDQKRIVSAGGDHTVRVWDVASGNEMACFRSHTAGVLGVCVSPDSRHAVSGSRDGTLRIWRLPDPNVALPISSERSATPGFREVHGVDADAFGSWSLESTREGYCPLFLSVEAGADRPRFNGIAVRNGLAPPSAVQSQLSASEARELFLRKTAQGFRPLVSCLYEDRGQQRQAHVYVKDGTGFSGYGTDWASVQIVLKEQAHDKRMMPIYFSARRGRVLPQLTVILGPDHGLPWREYLDLTPEGLRRLVYEQRARGWWPTVLNAYQHEDGQVRFLAVFAENGARLDWDCRVGMTDKEYEEALTAQDGRGLRPVAVASYREAGVVRYAAVWARYRVVSDIGKEG